jgi:Family of unknown function (DUF5670)
MAVRRGWGSFLLLEPFPTGCHCQDAGQNRQGELMLWTIAVILLILWLLGALGTVSLPILSGSAVHVLLVIVVIIVILQLVQRS